MGFNRGPKIPMNGIIFLIDAGNPKCFQSGNTSCTDLIRQASVTGANGEPGTGTHTPNTANFPSYNSEAGGCFDFAGGKGMNVEEDLGSHSVLSLSMWFYRLSGGTQYITDARNDGGEWFLSNYTNDNINYHEDLTYNFGGTYNASNPNFINQWIHMVVTSDLGGSLLYLNGELATGGSRAALNKNLGVNFRIGTRYTTANEWTGKMNLVSVYNRVINQSEVTDIYNATKSRFGL